MTREELVRFIKDYASKCWNVPAQHFEVEEVRELADGVFAVFARFLDYGKYALFFTIEYRFATTKSCQRYYCGACVVHVVHNTADGWDDIVAVAHARITKFGGKEVVWHDPPVPVEYDVRRLGDIVPKKYGLPAQAGF